VKSGDILFSNESKKTLTGGKTPALHTDTPFAEEFLKRLRPARRSTSCHYLGKEEKIGDEKMCCLAMAGSYFGQRGDPCEKGKRSHFQNGTGHGNGIGKGSGCEGRGRPKKKKLPVSLGETERSSLIHPEKGISP